MTTAFTDKAKTIVISIFSALLGLMLFCSPVFADQINNSDDEVITLDLLKKAQRSLEFFKGTQKRYNKNLLEAIDWGTFNKEMQFDIWANQICYLTAGKKNSNYILTSAGPDGQFLTWDDIDAPADSARHSLKYEHMMKSENKYIKVMIASELGAYKGEGLDVTEFLSGAMPREKSVTLVKEVIKKLEADKELGTRLKKAIIEKRNQLFSIILFTQTNQILTNI